MARPKPTRSNPALRFALLRHLHVYVSIFVAPSLIFFAVTGALQTFRLPDRPEAPALLVKLARVHRDDVFALKPPKPRGEAEGRAKRAAVEKPSAPEKPKEKASTTILKWFFALVSIAIVVTTLFGLWMAVAYNRRKAVVWALLIAGAAAPILILMASS